jgi:hypothetical protein
MVGRQYVFEHLRKNNPKLFIPLQLAVCVKPPQDDLCADPFKAPSKGLFKSF